MPRECAACKQQPASVLARLHRDEKSIVAPLCQQCLIRLSQKTRVEILEAIPEQESVEKKKVQQKATHSLKRSKKPLLITLVVLLLLASIVYSVVFIVPLIKKAIQKESSKSTTESETITNTPMTAEQIYEYASLATVEITAYNDDFVSTGTGFFCDTDEYLITNYHVIEDATDAYITIHDGGRYDILGFYGYDADNDIALLTTTYVPDTILKSSKDTLQTGESVYVIGSSEGLTASFSSGIISSSHRIFDGLEFIQITAPISHGNSGGPVLNNKGEVIGISTAAIEEGQNLNFAIPINEAKSITENNLPFFIEHKENRKFVSEDYFNEVYNSLVDHIKFYGKRTDYDIPKWGYTVYRYEFKSEALQNTLEFLYWPENNDIRLWYEPDRYDIIMDLSLNTYPHFNCDMGYWLNSDDLSHYIGIEQELLYSETKIENNEIHFEIKEVQGENEEWLSGQKKLAYNNAFNKRLDEIMSLFSEFCESTPFPYTAYDFGFID